VQFRGLLRHLGQQATVVVSTHLVEDVGAACTEVALMARGKIAFRGTPDELTARGEGTSTGDSPLERGYTAALADAFRAAAAYAPIWGVRASVIGNRLVPDLVPFAAGICTWTGSGVVVPALHDAASDRPVPYIPACGQAAGVPVCVHPAFGSYLQDVTKALQPVLAEVAGLPGAPTHVQRFEALPAAARHAWLATHLAALRAGHISLEQLP
jgi:hypothetical protein